VAASFGSDNHAGALPEVLAAIAAANVGHAESYGDDEWTARAVARFREHFGEAAEVLLAFNGTGANVVALAAHLRPHEAVICTESAHVNLDECGAPERFIGCRLLAQRSPDGKLRPADVLRALGDPADEHRVQPRVVSVSQATEWGTVYRPDELRGLAEVAHAHGLLLHVDGARLANAAAFLGVPLAEAAARADVVTVGGTKNGLLYGEAVVFRAPAPGVRYMRKQATQLASKMRFIAAQFEAVFEDDLWLRAATHANAQARRLGRALEELGVELAVPVESNAVFARVTPEVREGYVWDEERSIVRWMTAWDTSDEDVDAFVRRIEATLRATNPA
jgi:threonine aldolase